MASIQLSDIGISIHVPEEALSPAEGNVDLLIRPCFSGPIELPAGYEPASPTYLIKPSRKVEFQKDVTLKIHHYANLQSEEDCAEMAFLSASTAPQQRKSGLVYIFREIKESKGVFSPTNSIGEVSLRHFCHIKIGRKRKREHEAASEPCKSMIRCDGDDDDDSMIFFRACC